MLRLDALVYRPSSIIFRSGCLNVCADTLMSRRLLSANTGVGQTYEGGMAAYPGNEAHGAYAFCVLACLCILGEPIQMIPK